MIESHPSHPAFRKSTASATGACVEVAVYGDGVLVRDSKNPTGPRLEFNAQEWVAFLAGVRSGEFDFSSMRTP